MRVRAGHRGLAAVIGTVVSLLLLSACGASPYTYVANSDQGAYVRLPAEWSQIEESELVAAIGLDSSASLEEQGLWVRAFDAAQPPSSAHVLGASADEPAVLVYVRDIPEQSRGQFSLDTLRDMFQPVSETARQQLEANPLSSLSGFQLLRDEVLTPGDGFRGVHVTYAYRINGGPAQVFDQISYLNDDASTVYLVVARCSSDCFEQRQREIENVVSTFTVREVL